MATLEDWAAPVLNSWPESDSDDMGPIRLSAETIPSPENLTSDRLVLDRGSYRGGSFRFDVVTFFSAEDALASLGLLIFSAILHDGSEDLEVTLLEPSSDVKRLRIDREPLRTDSACELKVRPLSYDYYWTGDDEPTMPRGLHVASYRGGTISLPEIRLTNQRDDVNLSDEHELAARDVLHGFGGLAGAISFAELLLNVSRPWVTRTEVLLESYPGDPAQDVSVGSSSAWMRILLPGDPSFPDDILS